MFHLHNHLPSWPFLLSNRDKTTLTEKHTQLIYVRLPEVTPITSKPKKDQLLKSIMRCEAKLLHWFFSSFSPFPPLCILCQPENVTGRRVTEMCCCLSLIKPDWFISFYTSSLPACVFLSVLFSTPATWASVESHDVWLKEMQTLTFIGFSMRVLWSATIWTLIFP